MCVCVCVLCVLCVCGVHVCGVCVVCVVCVYIPMLVSVCSFQYRFVLLYWLRKCSHVYKGLVCA